MNVVNKHLLDTINNIDTLKDKNKMLLGCYESFLSKFALAEGKGKGEFYTPKSIVNVAEMMNHIRESFTILRVVQEVCSYNP